LGYRTLLIHHLVKMMQNFHKNMKIYCAATGCPADLTQETSCFADVGEGDGLKVGCGEVCFV